MDTREENRRRLASSIVIITSVLLCSAASGLFTTGIGLHPITKWAGFIIGLVNGLLTNTAGFGVIIGIVGGPVPSLILA